MGKSIEPKRRKYDWTGHYGNRTMHGEETASRWIEELNRTRLRQIDFVRKRDLAA